jgi:16S rRNA (guanine(966)-N(2))-methyltransferase RsmD
MDMAREGLFNVLANRFDFSETAVLDLFGGTGSISFEFISRGCIHATIVEKNIHMVRFIDSVAKTLEVSDRIRIVKDDAMQFIRRNTAKYNIVFADPPYDFNEYAEITDMIFRNKLLNEGGIFILEHDRNIDFSSHPFYSTSRKYGSNIFSFFASQKDS